MCENLLRYIDLDGKFAYLIPAIPAVIKGLAVGATIAAIIYYGYKTVEAVSNYSTTTAVMPALTDNRSSTSEMSPGKTW